MTLLAFIAVAFTLLQQPQGAVSAIDANDNRVPAGRIVGGELRVQLEARRGRWSPESERDPSLVVHAFAEVGRRPQIPGPLIRVRAGTRIQATVRNTLAGATLTVYGLHGHPGSTRDTIQIAPGGTRDVRFDAGVPGTYFYWATTTGDSLEAREGIDSQLSGAIVVDSADAAGPPRDRVFVIGVWHADRDTTGPKPWVDRDQMVINGKSWPNTERFSYSVGDTVRWRWVNPSADSHPMHLHGFYFQVERHGTWARDTLYGAAERRQVVTELMLPGETMATSWMPTTTGAWLFHCHFPYHASHFLSFNGVPDPPDPGAPNAADHSVHGMRGLVLGIDVTARRGSPVSLAARPRATTTTSLRLLMQTAHARYDTSPGYGFVLQHTPAPIRRDSVPTISSTIVLRRGETARINVVNHLRAPSAVHWHGIELADSYYDGVPGWSGTGNQRAPAIAPNDSFVAELVPPRAGTFMYHSHTNESHQIASGLYGALIVLDSGRVFDPVVDRVFVIGGNGPNFGRGRVNGQLEPPTQTLEVGKTYRFRIVQIDPDWRLFVSLTANAVVQRWRAVAKDGADLPASQAVERTARILMGPGETADFEITPRSPGTMQLEVTTQLKGWRVVVPLRIERAR